MWIFSVRNFLCNIIFHIRRTYMFSLSLSLLNLLFFFFSFVLSFSFFAILFYMCIFFLHQFFTSSVLSILPSVNIHCFSSIYCIFNYCLLCFISWIFQSSHLSFFITFIWHLPSIFNPFYPSIYQSFIHITSFYLGNQYHILIFILAFF